MMDKVNGWMMSLRIILPILLTVMLFMLGGIQRDQAAIRVDVDSLTMNLHTEVVAIRERLSVVETLLRKRRRW